MFRKIMGWAGHATPRGPARRPPWPPPSRRTADAFGAAGDAHHSAQGPRRAAHAFDRSAYTSVARSCGARPLSTALTYLWPSVPPNSLASSMHSFEHHAPGARRCSGGTRRRRSHILRARSAEESRPWAGRAGESARPSRRTRGSSHRAAARRNAPKSALADAGSRVNVDGIGLTLRPTRCW